MFDYIQTKQLEDNRQKLQECEKTIAKIIKQLL